MTGYVEPPITDDRVLLSISEAARLLSISRSTLYSLLGDGQLPSVRIASRRLLARNSIDEFVEKRNARPVPVGHAFAEVAGVTARSVS